MVKKKASKKRADNYEKPLAIAGTFSEVIKVALGKKDEVNKARKEVKRNNMHKDEKEISEAVKAAFPKYYHLVAVRVKEYFDKEKLAGRNLHYAIDKDVPSSVKEEIKNFIIDTGSKLGIPVFTDVDKP
jgi:hypothetical protein